MYTLVLLVVMSAISILSIVDTGDKPRLTITLGDPDMPIVEKRTLPLEEIGPIIEKMRLASPLDRENQLIKKRDATPAEIREYIQKILKQQTPRILHGIPLGDPNRLQHLSKAKEHAAETRGT